MTINSTLIFQNELPTLPIPPLDSTKSKLLEWIEPLVSEEQFRQTSNTINRFFEKGGEAEKLQAKLQEWAQSRNGSWLAPFWEEAYLTHRESLPYSSNFNILLKNAHFNTHYTTAEMAGKVSFLVTELYHMIIDETVEPDTMRGKRLDMANIKIFSAPSASPN